MQFTVTVEAEGYGHPEDEGDALLGALPDELDADLSVDPARGMIRVKMFFDAGDAREAHEQTAEVWDDAWDEAMSENRPPMRLAIVARPFDPVEDAATLEADVDEPAVA